MDMGECMSSSCPPGAMYFVYYENFRFMLAWVGVLFSIFGNTGAISNCIPMVQFDQNYTYANNTGSIRSQGMHHMVK